MKKIVFMLGLFSASTMLFAEDCSNLGITITNATNKTCTLKRIIPLYGSLSHPGSIPKTLQSGETSTTFFMQQDSTGIGIELDYRCEGDVAIFYSYQEHCGFSAGEVGGSPYVGSDLSLEYAITTGSYWNGMPGQISWRIF